MFSEATLRANLAALDRTQQPRPIAATLEPEQARLSRDADGRPSLELRTADAAFVPLEGEDVLAAAKAHADALGPEIRQVVIVGAGLGYLLDELERRRPRPKAVVLETDRAFALHLLSRRDWTDWLDAGSLKLLVAPDYLGASGAAACLDGAQPTQQFVNPALAAHRAADVERARSVATRLLGDATANATARRRFAGRYLTHTLRNLPRIAASANVTALSGLLTGRPAIVVGAGPSLDDNLPALAEASRSAVLVAADTALRPLLAAGIAPHLVVAVDPAELNAQHLADLTGVDAVHLVAEGSLHPSAFPPFDGRTFTFKVSDHDPWPWLRQAGGDRGRLQAWGSVITSAFDLARRMGCDPVLFAGLDLAFTHDRPYCTHTTFDRVWLSSIAAHGCSWEHVFEDYFSRVAIEWAIDVNGTRVRTTRHLLAFRRWLVEQMAADVERRYINATGAGMLYGTRIEQAPMAQILGGTAVCDPDSTTLLAQAYRASVRGVEPIYEHARGLAQHMDAPTSRALLERWVAFSCGGVNATDLREALSDAVAGFDSRSTSRPPVSA